MTKQDFYLGGSAASMAWGLGIFLYAIAIKIPYIRLVTVSLAVNIMVSALILYYIGERSNNERILDN